MKIKMIITTVIAFFGVNVYLSANAKEIQMILNTSAGYLMNVHYQVSSGGHFYAKGTLEVPANNKTTYYVAINEIPDDQSVLVQINKMNVGNVTEFNDPCEISLDKNQLTANMNISFKGQPGVHGSSFNCFVTSGTTQEK